MNKIVFNAVRYAAILLAGAIAIAAVLFLLGEPTEAHIVELGALAPLWIVAEKVASAAVIVVAGALLDALILGGRER